MVARSGSQHLEFLLENKLTRLSPSPALRNAYTKATLDASLESLRKDWHSLQNKTDSDATAEERTEQMILPRKSGKAIAEQIEVPGLEVEIERAVWQVERAAKPDGNPREGRGEEGQVQKMQQ